MIASALSTWQMRGGQGWHGFAGVALDLLRRHVVRDAFLVRMRIKSDDAIKEIIDLTGAFAPRS